MDNAVTKLLISIDPRLVQGFANNLHLRRWLTLNHHLVNISCLETLGADNDGSSHGSFSKHVKAPHECVWLLSIINSPAFKLPNNLFKCPFTPSNSRCSEDEVTD